MIGLVEDTGSINGDLVTSNPTILIRIQGDLGTNTARIDIDHNQDGTADGSVNSVVVDSQYIYDPRLIDAVFNQAAGSIHMAYRGVELDPSGNEVEATSWQNFEFTLAASTASVGVTSDSVGVSRNAGTALVTVTLDCAYDSSVTLNWSPREGSAILGENWTNGNWNDGYLQGAVWVEGHFQDNNWIDEHWENQVWISGYWTTPEWIEPHQEGGTWVEGGWRPSEWIEGHLENPVWVEGHFTTEYTVPDTWINQTLVPGGYEQIWIPGHECQVWKEDHYVEVFVPEQFVPERRISAHFDELETFIPEVVIPAHTESAHFEQVFRPMGYYWEFVEGHYETGDWIPEHYEGGELIAAHLVQEDWVDGHWEGTLVPGQWTPPTWIDGHWDGGGWVQGTWTISEWIAGYYDGGSFVEGHWQQSNWIDSQWEGGTWVPGWWSDQGGEITFGPGELTKTISLTILPTWFGEADRIFYIDFHSPGQNGTTLATTTITITA